MEQILAGLSNRIFLLNNTHDDAPEVFETRWAMSYLRGPLTRVQIKALMDPQKGQSATAPASAAEPAKPSAPPPSSAAQNQRPVLPPEVTQYFIPVRSSGGATLSYHPMIIGDVEIHYSDSKKVDLSQNVTLLTAIIDGPVSVDWDKNVEADLPVEDLESEPQSGAQFGQVPSAAGKAKNYDAWKKDLSNWVYRNQRLELLESEALDLVSNRGESERDFRVRLQQFAREQRDGAVEKLRQKYAPKIDQLNERKRRAEQAVEREAEQAKGQKLQTAISFGATLLSSFMGRKTVSLSTLGRATTAVRGVGRSMKESEDVSRAQDNVAAIDQQLVALDQQFKDETAKLEQACDPQTEELGKVSLKPTKTNIAVKFMSLVWAPYSDDKPAWE